MDQSDVKYLLKQQNIHLQSQGFSALISAIKTENDAKKKKYLHGILMECLQSECGNLSCWASEAIVLLQSSSNPGTLLDEVMASVRSEGHNVHTLIDLLFRMVNNQNGGNKTALGGLVTRLSKMLPVDQTHLLLEHVKQLPMAKSIPIASKLIHSPHLNSGFKLALLSQTLAAKQENVHKCLSCLLESITNCFIMPNLYLFANQLITYPETASDLLSSSLANNPHYLAMLLPIADCKDNMFEVIGLLSCGNLAQAQAVLQLSRIQLSEHPSYLPSLLSLYSIVQELNKCKVLNPDFPVEVLKKNLQACQLRFSAKQGHFVEGEHVETLTEYLAWIVQKKSRCANFLKFWLQSFQANSHAQTLHTSLAFVSGLYAFLDDASECTDLFQLCNLLAEAPILQNQLLLLFFSFFSHANLDKKQLILKNLPNLAKNQVVARQILKFLFALCRTTSKQLAFEVVGELWAKHNWIANEPELEQYFVRIDQKSDDRETTYLKMGLIRRICKIQQGERFVPQLLNLLHPNHPEQLLAETILALTDLCGQSLLKVDKVKAKVDAVFPEGINSDVKWPRVVSAYCNLLSTSAVDPNDYNLALTYVEELWQLKNSSNQEVCVSAWNSLSKFPLSTLNASRIAASPASSCLDLRQIKIEEGTCSKEDTSSKLTGIQLLAISKEIQSVESYQAFGNFLHKVISCEVEELPKPYYTEVKQESRSGAEINTQSSSTLLLVNLMPVLRETLENGGTSSLDLAAFALAEPITKHLQPNTKRMAKCTHLLSYALLKARADSNLEFSNTLNYFASWKSGIEFSFRLFHETRKKTNVHFTVAMARDMFIELMQKAIDQVKDAAVNVVCCLPFLWDTVNDMLAECPAESVDIHWQVSVVEYLLMLAIEDYQPKSLPIFQKETMRTCQLSAAAFFSLSLILHRHTIDYYNNACLPELILRNISSSCPAWMEYLIKGILWLASSPLPPQPQQPLVKVKLEPTDEGDLEQQQASPTSTTGSPLSLVVNSLVNNIPISQTVDLLEICQSRHNVKVLSNILNVNPSLVANILDELPNPQGLQDKFKSVAKDSNLAELANLKTAFQLFSELTESDHLRFGHQFAKRIEKTIAAFNAKTVANQRSGLNFSNATKNIVAECASCCLGEFYVGNLPGRSGAVADSKKNYKELPEGSVLKEVLNELRTNSNGSQKEVLLKSLLGHLRTDFKSLPPIDWAVLYSVGEQSTFYRHLFQLAVQQKSAKLLTKLLQANHLNLQSDLVALCPVITPNIQCLLDLLPNSIFTALLDSLLSAITLANYPDPSIGLVKQLAQMSISDPSVRTSIWRHAPSLQAASLLMHPFYNHFSDCFEGSTCPNESKASLENNLMQAWLEAKKKFKMNVQKIVTIFARITSEETPVTADTTASSLLILAKCSMELSNKERIAFLAQLIPMLKIVKVSFRSKNSPRDHKSVQVYFDLLVAFVVSAPSLTGLPFFFLDPCNSPASTWVTATHRFPVLFREFVTQLLAADRGCDGFKEVVIYLVELYCPALTEEQTKAIKACLRSCVNFAPPISIELIEAAGIWEDIFN